MLNVFFSLALFPLNVQDVSSKFSASDLDAIHIAVIKEAFRDFYARDRSVKFIVVGGITIPDTKPTTESAVAAIRTSLPIPIRRSSAGPKDIDYHNTETLDAKGRRTGVAVQIEGINTVQASKLQVVIRLGRLNYQGRLELYSVVHKGGVWRVLPLEKVHDFELSGRSGKHGYHISLQSQVFQMYEHTVKETLNGTNVDGHKAIGTDSSAPYWELSRFKIVVDGHRWSFPAKYWKDCFDQHLEDGAKAYSVILSSDGQRMQIQTDASDGAGGYRATWKVRRDGHVSRSISYLD